MPPHPAPPRRCGGFLRCLLLALLILPLAGSAAPTLAPAATPALPTPPTWSAAALEQVIAAGPGGRDRPHLGVAVDDLTSGQSLYRLRASEAFVPASTLKLVTAAAALHDLGPGYWYSTSLSRPALPPALPAVPDRPGQPDGAVLRAQPQTAAYLTLSGIGDPSLSVAGPENSLRALAQGVARQGLRRVGELRLDARLLPGLPLPESEVQPSGLFLDERAPGDHSGDPDPAPPGQAGLLRVGELLRAELERAGVQVTGPVRVAGTRAGEHPGRAAVPDQGVAGERSRPLAALLPRLLRFSDNRWADQLYARLGIDETTPTPRASSAAYAAGRLRAMLVRAGISAQGAVLADGSGLSRRNRLSPAQLGALLRFAYGRQGAAALTSRPDPWLAALPLAGTGTATPAQRSLGGTLATRLVAQGLTVRAKTGTLPGVSALAGYLQDERGHVLAFALMMDGYPGPGQALRGWQDRMVAAIAVGASPAGR